MLAALSLLALTASTVSTVSAQYLNQSAPFQLQIVSDNSTINGSILASCHEGAAIEGLCLATLPVTEASTYYFNYSSFATPDPVLGDSGYLTWVLQGGNFVESEPMSFSYNPTSDVAVPLFEPAESGTVIGFDKDGLMHVPSYLDDTVSPPKEGLKAYYRWALCYTEAGYYYQTLSWIVGVHTHAQNPTCQKVSVKQVFI